MKKQSKKAELLVPHSEFLTMLPQLLPIQQSMIAIFDERHSPAIR